MKKAKIAVLISGNGSNLQALIDACQAPDYPAEIALVLSNNANAYGLKRAEKAHIPIKVISHAGFATREAFDKAMHTALQEVGIEYVCLAGFMRLLSPWFVQSWKGRMLNIHPSLLPSFKGLNAIDQALQAKVKITGCTLHIVTTELDSGPIILQAAVDVLPNDTKETLATRIHAEEHRIYVEGLKLLIAGEY